MKEVRTAKTAGFCFGVEKAVKIVYDEVEKKGGKVYTYGPIIHNEVVVEDLEKRGVDIIYEGEDLSRLEKGTIIIRSHGIARAVQEDLEKAGMKIVDATCPFVKKIHRIVERECKKGRKVIIIGNPSHPEVEGIKGWGNEDTLAVKDEEDFVNLALPKETKISVVAQTTYNFNKFEKIIDKIKFMGYDITCFNTICNATQERQIEAEEIASEVDAMIVIGGKNSSNTSKLVDICNKSCKNTIFIQTLDDLDTKKLVSVRSVGITAGASTPKHIIEEVQNNVRSQF
ncbi:MAG: 4-hydroxy-3-methylbut-2-enyl diphosphate reductase [Johnsonella sp.]|nr:4-hydroxy-3-methylbut-2-enyl diphosphate reductase [Johnsonella sp.]